MNAPKNKSRHALWTRSCKTGDFSIEAYFRTVKDALQYIEDCKIPDEHCWITPTTPQPVD